MTEARRAASGSRPNTLHISRSFTRMDNASTPDSPRKRASTLQEAGIPAIPEARPIDGSPGLPGNTKASDVFENREDDEEPASLISTPNPSLKLPSTFDDLPIEIKSLTERFLEGLSAKVHPTPLTIDALSDMFQDFYELAGSHIGTHIARLSSRIGKQKSSSSLNTQKSGKTRARQASGSESPGGEMLTASEVADRRKARRLLELKRIALEDGVERAVCERVYDRIWKHRSTDDDARDEKLRSRTAALAVVGIGLKELHMDSDASKEDVRKIAEEKGDEIHQSLAGAREALQRMDDEHYPFGKLQHLITAHQSIVETLSQLFPSSSSADEILPTLIYTLITSPPEGINVVSNLNFIQRFRATNKVDGEAAYCLVNLEAAISFLETVDLSSLRADELPQGPSKPSGAPPTPTVEKTLSLGQVNTAQTLRPTTTTLTAEKTDTSTSRNDAAKTLSSPRTPTPSNRGPPNQRRLSYIMQQQADRLEAGRENLLNAADKVYDSINGALENSLQFVFGRFKDQVAGDSPLPKTLEEARRLVSSPTAAEEAEALRRSGRSSPTIDDPLNSSDRTDNKMLELLGGRKQIRERSVDSSRSGGSGRRVSALQSLANDTAALTKEKPKEDAVTQASNLFAQINPLNRFGVPNFTTRFGRSPTVTTGSPVPTPSIEKGHKLSDIVESPLSGISNKNPLERQISNNGETNGDDDLNARESLAELRKIKPPKKRFLEVQSADELRIGEVEDLLAEYRRLAKAIGEAIAE
ncbi:Hypothetical protein R9X50_00207800 [Acrodontium crateriforme]|uniref:VPS9 domain-containing protein n=1 Tax=Acrodontium crateriforme TaxID=150365 RepID=A0AAQ3M6A5_9PEZI|nr:Hypothetical protein R9X50_00207800 [Acrodontium crateriforme]